MPRCYMVKKQSNKYQSTVRDCWDQNPSSLAPESPTEGSVAPCYTPLTNRTNYSQEFIPNGSVEKKLLETKIEDYHRSSSDGEIPICRNRSAEETEAAHDLLSLSQSLPPLQAPSVVMIHHIIPSEDDPPSPTHCYRPLSPENSHLQESAARPPPNYPSPIVYVVQVPAVPTPPTSECSSDAENLQICTVDRLGHPSVRALSNNHSEDILILPLSPDPDSHEAQEEMTTNSDMVTGLAKQETVIASSHLNIPDRRKRKNKRTNKTNKTSKNNNDSSTTDHNIDSSIEANATKTKFYKVVEDEPDEEVDLEATTETDNNTSTNKASRYVCGECGKQYATSSNLSRHKQTHRSLDSQSAKKCLTCGKAYVSMPALAMHLLTHKLAHGCGICGKQFSRPWLLQGHLRSHTGEKPYGCAHCGKAFADRSNLRAHMQTHSGDKNFSCPKCQKTFALKSYLNKHQESACMVWDAKMNSYKRLSVHAETQTITVD